MGKCSKILSFSFNALLSSYLKWRFLPEKATSPKTPQTFGPHDWSRFVWLLIAAFKQSFHSFPSNSNSFETQAIPMPLCICHPPVAHPGFHSLAFSSSPSWRTSVSMWFAPPPLCASVPVFTHFQWFILLRPALSHPFVWTILLILPLCQTRSQEQMNWNYPIFLSMVCEPTLDYNFLENRGPCTFSSPFPSPESRTTASVKQMKNGSLLNKQAW